MTEPPEKTPETPATVAEHSKESGLFEIDEQRMYEAMISALERLHDGDRPPEYVAITCLIMCYIDAISAGPGRAKRKKFIGFLHVHFKELCDELGAALGVADGAETVWNHHRNGLIHKFFPPDTSLALAEDHELQGRCAGPITSGGRRLIAINVDRLYRDFLDLARERAERAKAKKGK